MVDTNGDGVGDSPLLGIKVALEDSDGNTLFAVGTDETGAFQFFNVPPGNYQIVETSFAGYSHVSNNTIAVTVGSGGVSVNNTFVDKKLVDSGTTVVGAGLISGMVLVDTNGDGIGDKPLNSVRINLLNGNGESLSIAGTDDKGQFAFYNVPPGNYLIQQKNFPGFVDVADSQGDPRDNMINVTLSPGQSSVGNQFVDAPNGSPTPSPSAPSTASPTGKSGARNAPIAASPYMAPVVSYTPVSIPATKDPPSVKAVETSIADYLNVKTSKQSKQTISSGAVAGITIAAIVVFILGVLFNRRQRNIRGSSRGLEKSRAAFTTNFSAAPRACLEATRLRESLLHCRCLTEPMNRRGTTNAFPYQITRLLRTRCYLPSSVID